MTSFYVGQQVVVNDDVEGELMGTIVSINEEDIRVLIEGDYLGSVAYRPSQVRSYVDIYTQADPKPNVFVGPFAAPVLSGLIEHWLNQESFDGVPNKDYPFDEDNSFSWAIKEMKEVLERISK